MSCTRSGPMHAPQGGRRQRARAFPPGRAVSLHQPTSTTLQLKRPLKRTIMPRTPAVRLCSVLSSTLYCDCADRVSRLLCVTEEGRHPAGPASLAVRPVVPPLPSFRPPRPLACCVRRPSS